MISIRVWNLESDHDPQAVKFLENEFGRFRHLGDLAIRTAGRSALRKCHRKGAPLRESLRRAIRHYLAQDNSIIFVVDSDEEKQLLSSPLVNQLDHVVKDCGFSDKVFFVPDIQEEKLSIPTQWQKIVSDLHIQINGNRQQFRKEWDKTMTHFHDAFADTPEEEVIRDFEEALAEVRRERT